MSRAGVFGTKRHEGQGWRLPNQALGSGQASVPKSSHVIVPLELHPLIPRSEVQQKPSDWDTLKQQLNGWRNFPAGQSSEWSSTAGRNNSARAAEDSKVPFRQLVRIGRRFTEHCMRYSSEGPCVGMNGGRWGDGWACWGVTVWKVEWWNKYGNRHLVPKARQDGDLFSIT